MVAVNTACMSRSAGADHQWNRFPLWSLGCCCPCRAGQGQVVSEADDKEARIAAAARAVALRRGALLAEQKSMLPGAASSTGHFCMLLAASLPGPASLQNLTEIS